MGQQSSKSHAPLTFGYINHTQPRENDQQDTTLFEQYLDTSQPTRDRQHGTPDFVLEHPHLYKLEFTCRECTTVVDTTSIIITEKQVNKTCKQCRQNKRLSLVRQDLASDLNYIDETYYPNIAHYEDEGEESIMLSDTEEEEEEEGWSKLTIGQITQSIPKRLVSSPQLSVDLSGKSLVKLNSSIGYLDNITKLDLSDNQMIQLPKAIGQLKNLRVLNASKNQLESIPDTITHLKKLKAANFSHNKLTLLPKGMGSLPNLVVLILNQNQLTEIPRELANINDLITLNVSNNPLKTIPAEIATLKTLRKLIAEECPFEEEFNYSLVHNPPSLFEFCARQMSRESIPLPPSLQHHPIADYFKREQSCSFCFHPFFDSFVMRGKFIERTGRQLLALDYKLCCAHWSDENDRISAMFSTPYYRQNYIPQENEISTDGLSTPVINEEQPQSDYFSSNSMLSMNGRQSSNVPISSPSSSSSSESMLLTTFSPPESITPNDMTRLHLLSSHRPTTLASSSSSSRPRSSSTSSSSMLRIHAMHQNISATLRQQQQEPVRDHTILPFATLHGRQTEEANRILHPHEDIVEEPQEEQQQQQQEPTRRTMNKKPNSRVIKDGFASLGAKLGRRGRDRSETF